MNLNKEKEKAVKRMIESITVNGRPLLGADEAHFILGLPEVENYFSMKFGERRRREQNKWEGTWQDVTKMNYPGVMPKTAKVTIEWEE